MKAVRKKIDGLHHAEFVTVVGQCAKVARQRGGVAGYVNKFLRAERSQFGFKTLGAGARGYDFDARIEGQGGFMQPRPVKNLARKGLRFSIFK